MNPDRAYRPEFDQRVIELGREGKWWAEMALGLVVELGRDGDAQRRLRPAQLGGLDRRDALVVRPRGAEDRRQAAAGDRLEHSGGQMMADGALTPPRDAGGRFGKGNPGRRRGSRNRLTNRLALGLLDDFSSNEAENLARLRRFYFPQYVQLMARFLPRETREARPDFGDYSAEKRAKVGAVDGGRSPKGASSRPRGASVGGGEMRHLVGVGLDEGRARRGAGDVGAAGWVVRQSVEALGEAKDVRHQDVGDRERARQPLTAT